MRCGKVHLPLQQSVSCSSQGTRSRWDNVCGVTRQLLRASSCMADREMIPGLRQMTAGHWKILYRTFLLQTHPDFFTNLPDERAVNENNLKALSLHLGECERNPRIAATLSRTLPSSSSRLIFFLKGESREVSIGDYGDRIFGRDEEKRLCEHASVASLEDRGTHTKLTPRKVFLPLHPQPNSTKLELQKVLQAAGIIIPEGPRSFSQREPEYLPRAPDATESFSQWDFGQVEDLFRTFHEGWQDRGGYDGHSRHHQDINRSWRRSGGPPRWQEYSVNPAGLAHVLWTEAGKTLVRERKDSARKVRALVDALRTRYGFGKFTFRCGWSKANLCVALSSLLEACSTHRKAFRVPNFGGLDVVIRNDPSVLDRGEIRLCPADVPLVWVSVLQGITPALLHEVGGQARETKRLEDEVSVILGGAQLSRGLSCSKSRYHGFLGRLSSAQADLSPGQEGTGLSQGEWVDQRCKVEEGFGRISKVLEDGTIQIGSEMTLLAVWRCLNQEVPRSRAVVSEYAQLRAEALAAAKHCQELLCLEALDRARGVGFAQMAAACKALADERSYMSVSPPCGGSKRTSSAFDSARERLRGHSVLIVGERHEALDGVTEDGDIAIPWDWALGAGRAWT